MHCLTFYFLLNIILFTASSVGFAEQQYDADDQVGLFSPPPTNIKNFLNPSKLYLRSSAALVLDQETGQILYARKDFKPMPIASITKLMTAMVLLDADLEMGQPIKIVSADKDRKRWSKSRLRIGSVLSRQDLLELALLASENRAAFALARTYPAGIKAFVHAMNRKAQMIGMPRSIFFDPTGLDVRNVASARDLSKMLEAAYDYPVIREITSRPWGMVFSNRRMMKIRNTNRLIRKSSWHIGLSKTGFLNDAGHCLVMQARILHRPVFIILLNSWGKFSKFGDANRIRRWLLKAEKKMQQAILHAATKS